MESHQNYSFHLNGVPLLLVSAGAPTDAARRGTVLLIHGLGANKEGNRLELDRLAQAGFLAIGLDAFGHGERRYDDFDARFNRPDREHRFIETVVATVNEIPALVEALKQSGLAHDGAVGLMGISMGGFIGYGAAAKRAVDALVALISSPVWKVDVPEHPIRHLPAFFPTAVLSIVAGKDDLVDARLVKGFHDRLATEYQGSPSRQALEVFLESGHHMRQEDWDAAMAKTTEWFRRFLKTQD